MEDNVTSFQTFISNIYNFAINELPDFLSYLVTPLDELTDWPDWVETIVPHSSMLELLFYSLIAVFLVRPILHFITDFVSD